MSRENVLLLAIILVPLFVVVVFPALEFVAPMLLFFGVIFASLIWLRSSFRQDKHGAFSQWTNPSKFIKMKFDEKEMQLLKVSGCIVLSGFLIIAVFMIRLNFIRV